jgi:hypothetical protein
VLGSVHMPDEGGYLVLGSTPLPRTDGAQPENISSVYHHPIIESRGGQKMEGRRHSHHQIGARSGKFIGGEGENIK